MMTRAEHLAWCKARALDYIASGDVQGAMLSVMSDLSKHDDTKPGIETMRLSLSVQLSGDRDLARAFIDGLT
jgi:hypothetical protein